MSKRTPVAWLIGFLVTASAIAAPSFHVAGSLSQGRSAHSVTLLPSGKVLIAGGILGAGNYLNSAELYDPTTGTVTPTAGAMTSKRAEHTATLMRNGKVLIAGGYKGGAIGPGNNGVANTVEIFDPATETFSSPAITMISGRYQHTATLLANGKVLIAGGFETAYLSTAEIFDPDGNGGAGTLTATGSLPTGRAFQTATLLPSGKVLLAGGMNNGTVLKTALLYDAGAGTFSQPAAMMTTFRTDHTATLLPNGLVLIAGGCDGTNGCQTSLGTAELFNPAGSGSFAATSTPMSTNRAIHTANLLPNGNVLLVGGYGTNNGIGLTTADVYSTASDTFAPTASLSYGRFSHAATLLPNGRVLVAAGAGHDDAPDTIELYEPSVPTFTPTTSTMVAVRYGHTATTLVGGDVLIAGGSGPAEWSTAEVFDEGGDSFTATAGTMSVARTLHSATLLPNGKVLIAGGSNPAALGSAELYNPATNTFAATGSMGAPRYAHTATLLANGKVLIVGGRNPSPLGSAELYDPAGATFQTTGSLSTARYAHEATLLPNGKVLITGGTNGTALSTAELYDPNSGTFSATAAPMTSARYDHTATLLLSGKVLIAGGNNGSSVVDTAEIYDTGSNVFAASVATMTSPRANHAAALHPTGKVLITGGHNGTAPVASAELYDGNTAAFTALPAMGMTRERHTATLLGKGQVLVAGGNGNDLHADRFDPGLGYADLRRPVLAGITTPVCQSGAITITGSFFMSDSEGSGGGTYDSAANAPLLRLQRVDNDLLRFVRSQSFSPTSFTSVALAGFPSGPYRTALVSNGVPMTEDIIDVETTPLVGAYPETTANSSGPTTITPTLPAGGYSGALYPLVVTASPGFTGTLWINGQTGVITVTNPAPGGDYTLTVSTSTSCGTASTSFTLHVLQPAPTGVVATATSPTSVSIVWSGTGGVTYEVVRVGAGGVTTTVGSSSSGALTDNTASASTAYLYKVRAISPSLGVFSAPDLATTVIFTDPTLTAGTTKAKAAHITELRTAVNAVRTLASLGGGTYADPTLTIIRAAHINDLRNALAPARSALSLAAATYTRPTITSGMSIAAVDVSDLRTGVR